MRITTCTTTNVLVPAIEFLYATWVVKNKKKVQESLRQYGWGTYAINVYIHEYEKKYQTHLTRLKTKGNP